MSAWGQKQTFAVHQTMSALPPIATSIAFFGMFALGQKRTLASSVRSLYERRLRLLGRPDLRRTHRLSHAEEDYDALTAAARGQRLAGVFVATVDVLPVVHHPDIAGG